MALPRPVLNTQVAFDATQAHTFTFTVYGSGAQVTANKLTIRKQSDNSIVYQQQQTTFKFEHTLPAGSLTNGNYYNAPSSPTSEIPAALYLVPEAFFE